MLPAKGYMHPDSMVSNATGGVLLPQKNPLTEGGKYNLDIYINLNTSSIMFIRVFISHIIFVSL
jgi:hypothetical protein